MLSRIHSVDISSMDLSFLPEQSKFLPGNLRQLFDLDESLDEARILENFKQSHTPVNRAVLLHGDFWPGNVLWKDEKIVDVIDWEDAKLGDPLADLAISRLDILLTFGTRAMDEFTHRYESILPVN